jgi:membrane peptidoglycan carboxypeptidase
VQRKQGPRTLPEPVIVVLAWLADAGESIFGRLRHYGDGPLQRSATAAGPARAALVAIAGGVGRTALHVRHRLAHAGLDPAGLRRRSRRWLADLRAAMPAVQEDALTSWQQFVTTDLPHLHRQATTTVDRAATLNAWALGAMGRGTVRGWRLVRPVLQPPRRIAAVLVPRLAVVLVVVGLAGWFAPGPLLGVAASMTTIDGAPFRPLAQRSTVVAADGGVLGVVHDGRNRRVVPLDTIPPLVRRLVALAEDRRFFEHDGYDQEAIVRAAMVNARAGGVNQGASTITQQLVKQNLVGADRSPLRKVRELVLTVAVERETTKQELLARYLNEVYFGNGAYGVAAATETYFGTTPDQLRPDQAAMLAVLIRAPARLDPWRAPAAVVERRNALLRAAAADGLLSARQAKDAARAGLGLLPRPRRPAITDPDLVRAVEAEIAARPELGDTPAERLGRYRTGGWTVMTTLDPAVQQAARRAAQQGPARLGVGGAAIAVVEPGTGRIKALASRRPEGMGQLELSIGGRRQPGSAFKPVAALAALEAGLDPKAQLEHRNERVWNLDPEDWEVHNFADSDAPPVDLAGALKDSVNSAFAQVGVAVGTERLADMAGRLGIDVDAALGPPAEQGPAIALGGVRHGVTALEMAGAYAAIADDGRFVRPTLIERIVGPDGRDVLRRAPDPRPAADPAVAAQVRSMLQEAVRSGTGTQAGLPGWDPFGKTGTSQDRADAWFVGAVPGLAAAVWIGDPQARTPMPTATGGTVAAPLWRDVMSAALAGRSPTLFPPPPPLPVRPPLPLPTPRSSK